MPVQPVLCLMLKLPADPNVKPPMVPDYASFEAGIRKYHGLVFDPTAGGEGSSGAWVPTNEIFTVKNTDPNLAEYIMLVRSGTLLALDAHTAACVGGKCPVHEPPTKPKGKE